jgi:membrane fusion protein (multidrug efflux system)
MKTILTITAMASLGLLGASCAQQVEETVTEERVVAVKALLVQPSDRQVTRTYTGSLAGEQQAVLHARLSEAVVEVRVGEGRQVAENEVLITLDKYGPSSQYAQTYSTYQNAKKNFEKMEFLFKQGAVSESNFDGAKTDYEVTRAQYEAMMRMVEIQSPIAGTVTSVNVSPGDLVAVGQELATIATTDRLRVKFGVNADDITFFRVGSNVVISSDAVDGTALGRVITIASSADPVSRKFRVEALIDNTAGLFSPGLFVHADYVLDELPGVLAVPRGAIINLDGQETVFASVAGHAQMRRVTLGADLSGDVVVTSGLNPGDTLITLGQDYLEEGLKLNITDLQE